MTLVCNVARRSIQYLYRKLPVSVILAVYVDNIFLTRNDLQGILYGKKQLENKFVHKNFGKLDIS